MAGSKEVGLRRARRLRSLPASSLGRFRDGKTGSDHLTMFGQPKVLHSAAHLAVLQHAEAHGVLAQPHEAAGAVDGVQHPVAARGAARRVAQVDQRQHVFLGQAACVAGLTQG